MEIEQVRLRKTLKSGKDVWIEGSYFPNNMYPSIPHDLLLEVRLNTGRVEVTKFKKPELVVPKKVLSKEQTSTFFNAKTSISNGTSIEEVSALKEQEEPVKLKSKSKLVRR